MKKKIIILTLLLSVMLIGCGQETYQNGVPTYFLEPEGYIIAKIDLVNDGIFGTFLYGYISKEDYQSYLDGTFSNSLTVKNPYEEGKEISTPIDKINYIKTGVYKDYREFID